MISNQYFDTFSYQFEHVTILKIFHSFYYQNIAKNYFNTKSQVSFKDSSFIKSLNSVIYLSSEIIYTNSSQVFIEQQVFDPIINSITLTNCCFSQCSTISQNSEGGAILIQSFSSILKLIGCVFIKCSSITCGGAISSQCQEISITSTIFSQCQSANTGMAIFYNIFKQPGSSIHKLTLNQIDFSNNKGKYEVNDLNATDIQCLNLNFSKNSNLEYNQPNSNIQYCCILPFFAAGWNMKFKFVNIISNDGDFLIDLNEKPNGEIFYVNILKNINLNYYFHFDRIINNPLQGDPLLNFNNFAFFDNKPRSEIDGVLFANPKDIVMIRLINCLFDYTQNQVNSMLNGHSEGGGQYQMSLSPGGNGFTRTHDSIFIKPNICEIYTDVFSPSNEFTDSLIFTKSKVFSPSNEFTPTLTFKPSSTFTSSSSFSDSSIFSSSSTFTLSSIFTKSKIFTQSVEFSSCI